MSYKLFKQVLKINIKLLSKRKTISEEINVSFKGELNRYILSRKNNDPFYTNYCKILNKTVKDVKDNISDHFKKNVIIK